MQKLYRKTFPGVVPSRNDGADYALRNIFGIYSVKHHKCGKFRRNVIDRESPVGRNPPPFNKFFAFVDSDNRVAVAYIDYKNHRFLPKHKTENFRK